MCCINQEYISKPGFRVQSPARFARGTICATKAHLFQEARVTTYRCPPIAHASSTCLVNPESRDDKFRLTLTVWMPAEFMKAVSTSSRVPCAVYPAFHAPMLRTHQKTALRNTALCESLALPQNTNADRLQRVAALQTIRPPYPGCKPSALPLAAARSPRSTCGPLPAS